MRKTLVSLAATAALVCPLSPGHASPRASLWEDPQGDVAVAGTAVPNATAAGVDLVGGEIARAGPNLEFVVHVLMEVPWTLPEGSRFMWHFDVGGQTYRLVGKSMHVGKPAEVAGGDANDGNIETGGHYRLERCDSPVEPLGRCSSVSYGSGPLFDPETDTFTFQVPLVDVGAKTGSVTSGGTGGSSPHGCQICWVLEAAERSPSETILDSATQTTSYRVPKK